MTIHLASHYGMCFGVRDALRATHSAALRAPVTTLGQLVHNPVVDRQLSVLGVSRGSLHDLTSAATRQVIITAHGSSDRLARSWAAAGHDVVDTTCPLVRKAHQALAGLVSEGYHPVVIGESHHVEVQGLVGDYPEAHVILGSRDIAVLPFHSRMGIVSQTTQPLDRVLQLVDAIKRRHEGSEVRFIDTVCHPTKQRQLALEDLGRICDVIIVIGGRNSNNTRQLTEKAAALGPAAHQIETPEELDPTWLRGARNVGVTAGTSTLDETVQAVMDKLRRLAVDA